MSANWFESEVGLQRILERQLGGAYERARPRLLEMGRRAATEVALWADLADHQGPRLRTHDRDGKRIDEIEYHPAYRWMQEVAYGLGIVAASYDPELAPERGNRPKALTFGLGYLFGQAECGLYCPVCMTDGAARLIRKYGSEELKRRYLPRLASRDLSKLYTGAMFLTEREGGSDVGQVSTVAKGSGAAAKLFGDKWFCSNVDADVIMILARPEGAGPGTRGLGLYLLPRTMDDGTRNHYRIERIKDKLGVRSMPTGEVTLDGAEAHLLGGPGQGFKQMTDMLNLSRLYNAVGSVAGMRRALREAISWAESRIAFGRRVFDHPLMAEVLLDLAAEQRAALYWTFRGVELIDKVEAGEATPLEAKASRLITPLLKYYLGRKGLWAASEGVEALGGNGYVEDWPMARLLRDAQVLTIWEGTTNVLTLDAFRAIRKEAAHEAFFEEVRSLAGEAPPDLQGRLSPMIEELASALAQLAADPQGEHLLRDWTDRASLIWEVGVLCSRTLGAGTEADLRAARRVLARNAPASLLRTDRATPEDVRLVAYG
ncbi:MAG: acyl-CoA dehydrogenase family protein [Myxococcales bacterium]|nr:acyl-CoA dehydrogenase family protein [Myxococcales bacterium]